jgi:hypothetical protein
MAEEVKRTRTVQCEVPCETYNGHDVLDVIRMAKDMAHYVREQLSIFRQEENLGDEIDWPLSSCDSYIDEFLDYIGD